MRLVARVAKLSVVAALLVLPGVVSAAGTALKPNGAWCLYNSECASNYCGWSNLGCQDNPNGSGATGISPGDGGINIPFLLGYRDYVLWFINRVIVPLLLAVAFLYFLYGTYTYFILGANNETALKKGRSVIFWGIIGFAAIISIWGLVWIVIATFGLATGVTPPSPSLL